MVYRRGRNSIEPWKTEDQELETVTCVYPHMVFIIGCTGKCPPTSWFCAVIRSFSCVCPNMHFSDIRCCERPTTAFKVTFKGPFSWKHKGKYIKWCKNTQKIEMSYPSILLRIIHAQTLAFLYWTSLWVFFSFFLSTASSTPNLNLHGKIWIVFKTHHWLHDFPKWYYPERHIKKWAEKRRQRNTYHKEIQKKNRVWNKD